MPSLSLSVSFIRSLSTIEVRPQSGERSLKFIPCADQVVSKIWIRYSEGKTIADLYLRTMPPAFMTLAFCDGAASISDVASREGKKHIMSVFVQHYAAVAIAALSGFVLLRLVADKTRYDKRELRKIFFEKILDVVWIEVFILLALLVSFIVGMMEFSFLSRIFLYIENFFGGLMLIGNVLPISVGFLCGGVSSRAGFIMAERLNERGKFERGKFHDLLMGWCVFSIGLCVFVLLNLVMVPLLTHTIARENFVRILTFGFAVSLAMIAYWTIFQFRSTMKSSSM